MSPNAQQDMDPFVCVYPTGCLSELAIKKSTLQQLTTDGGLPYLRIRFSDIASSRHGITFGSDPGCHVVINDNDVNKRHFCLGINKSRQVMLYDWGSSNGTYVTYKEQRRYLRNYFKWIIGGHPVVKDWNPVIVEPGAMWRFTIVVSDYTAEAIFPTQFNEELEDAFKTLCSEPDKRTRLHTGLDEPTSDSIQLTRPLGKGSFGSVVHSFDVSTGQVLALKTPVIGTMVNYPAWVKEARIMEAIRHRNIVKLIRSDLSDQQKPMLAMEFVPGGQLGSSGEPLQPSEMIQILSQLLSALDYLHTLPEPIVHRDIKQSNVLVQERSAGQIWVKYADFGVSKAGDDYQTAIGCPYYRAPEMHESGRYTTAVDIWTLGVMMLKLMGTLVEHRGELHKDWCETIIKEAARVTTRNPLIQFVLDHMVQMSPDRRLSAKECRVELHRQFSAMKDKPSTPDVLDMPEEGSSTSREPPREQGNQSTLVPGPSRKRLPMTSSGPVPGAESSWPSTKRKIPEESEYMPSTPGKTEPDASTLEGPLDDLSLWNPQDKGAPGTTRSGLRFLPVGGSTKGDTQGGTEAGTGRDADADGDAEGHRAKRTRLDDAES
ncbi:kinase-like domain-containing protein [Ilyonectria robusta]|uniref:kinase-like domain-containing protein n=1 Tax=Ilyonectria robusta TaxID=1079257 RepID=UPI001E8D253D|nr:kinase-like domain-containing protein [Ilyonectria robusta]KAH8714559.1 kinase-like domain-containing protein [Ilyonectria robusta]